MIKSVFMRPQALLGIGIITTMLLIAIMAPVISPNDPNEINILHVYEEPSAKFILGTDEMGRCVFSRLLYGARNSLFVAIPTLLLLAIISTCISSVCTYAGGWVDRSFVMLSDMLMAFPPLLVAVTLVGSFGQSYFSIVLSIVVSMWVWFAKVVRTLVLVEKKKPYILSCRIAGCRNNNIIFCHIIPNILPRLLVYFSTGISSIIITISGYAFLGLGFPAGTAEWGAMFRKGVSYLYSHPRLLVWPGICILVTTAGFNLFGEALRDTISPREG